MEKAKITTEISKSIQAVLMTGEFTYQDILNHLENKFTINQLKYHINKNYPHLKSLIKKEYSRGGSKLEYLLKQIFPANKIHSEFHVGDKLRLDFYIEAPYNLGFEFDGSQHHKLAGFFNNHADFQVAQERDLKKGEICNQYGINLIRYSSVEDLSLDVLEKDISQAGYGTGESETPQDQLISEHLSKQQSQRNAHQKKLVEYKQLRKQRYIKQKELLKEREVESSSCYTPNDDYKKKQKQRAKEFRKQQYQRQKEWKKQNKR